ncbi:PEBP-like protein [Daldinia loculata]|uniref:PEBP-like protein n=1 Tax=Daldinia loculata TaxID=103429 RepID=UPI0020C43283|nr:PEBP-like protein [Daldinia loculata]KAI1651842.1 PEBP-like protein [Daldinia loculata]
MLCKSLLILAGASATLASTPKGFEPGTTSALLVSFGDVAAADGNVLQQAATQTAPTIGTQSKVDGTSFAVLMIDLDIPTDSPPNTNTLLHWMQTGLTQSTAATPINTSTGSTDAFVFKDSLGQGAFAEYLGPAPPARIPLSHRYTQILVDTSSATEANLNILKNAAATRLGFDALSVLTQAGLADKILAGNFFNVTNPGPVTTSASKNSTTGNGSAGSTGTGSVIKPTQTPFVPSAATAHKARGMLLGIVMAGAVFITL